MKPNPVRFSTMTGAEREIDLPKVFFFFFFLFNDAVVRIIFKSNASKTPPRTLQICEQKS